MKIKYVEASKTVLLKILNDEKERYNDITNVNNGDDSPSLMEILKSLMMMMM